MAGTGINLPLLTFFNDKGVKEARASLGQLGDGIKNITRQLIGGYVGWQGLEKGVTFLRNSVDASRDLQRNLAGLGTIFGPATAEMTKFAEAGVALGMSTAEAAKATTFIGSVMKQSGFAMEENIMFTQKLVTLGADLAATYGYDVQEALTGMTAMFRGEYDPIEKFGVAIKQAQVNAVLAEKGLKGLTGAALLNAQQLVRMKLLLEATKDAQGAVARQSDTLAVSQARLAATFTNMQASLGNSLIGPITVLVQTMTVLTNVIGPPLTELFNAIGGLFVNAGNNANVFASQLMNIIGQITVLVKIAVPILNVLVNVLGNTLAPLVTMVVTFKMIKGVITGVGVAMQALSAIKTILAARTLLVAGATTAEATATTAAGLAASGAIGPTIALGLATLATPWGMVAVAIAAVAGAIALSGMIASNTTPAIGELGRTVNVMGTNMATASGTIAASSAGVGALTGNMYHLATATATAAKAQVLLNGTMPDYQNARAAIRADDRRSANAPDPALTAVNNMLNGIPKVAGAAAAAGGATRRAAAAMATPFQQAVKKIQDELAGLHDSLMGAFDITSMGKSGSTISRNMNKLMAKMREFTALIRQLKEKGLNADLLQQIVKAGPVAGLDAARALAGDAGLMNQANQSYSEFGALATQVASDTVQAKYQNQYNITVDGGVGSGATIGKAVVAAIQAYERQSGNTWRA